MQGGSLLNKVKELKRDFSEKEIMDIMAQICSAIEVLHSKGIAHRNINLVNILCTSETRNFTVKLADFGSAIKDSSKLNSEYNFPFDIWSLGVVMFFLCFGNLPFTNSNDSYFINDKKTTICSAKLDLNFKSWSNLSEDAKNLILRMLEADPAKRPNISEVLSHEWFRNKSSEKTLNSKEYLKDLSLSHFKKKLEEQLIVMMRNFHSENCFQLDLDKKDLCQERKLRLSPITEQSEEELSIYDNLIQN